MTQDLPNTRVKGIALDYAIARREHYAQLKMLQRGNNSGGIKRLAHRTAHDVARHDRQE